MTVYKWDFVKRKYDEYQKDVSESPTLCIEMARFVRCINCGRKIQYGDTYTSRRWHTKNGFGYPVCRDCYDREWKEERRTMEKLKQKQRILDYMNLYGSITPMDAFEDLGITKLSTRIGELKRDGYPIESRMEKGHSRWGDECKFKRYWIHES